MDYSAQFGRLARHIQLIAVRATNETDCHPQPNINLCEKPSSDPKATGITIGALAGGIALVVGVVLTYLHFRHKRMDEKEWPKNNQELDDYGFNIPQSQKTKRPTQDNVPGQQQGAVGGASHVRASTGSLDDLERSLRGHTTDAFKRHDDDVPIDVKPVTPADRI